VTRLDLLEVPAGEPGCFGRSPDMTAMARKRPLHVLPLEFFQEAGARQGKGQVQRQHARQRIRG
jgi:hypothetical protein